MDRSRKFGPPIFPLRLFVSQPFPPCCLDGLIVLGASLNSEGRPGRVARLRLVHALHLWRHHFPRAYLLLTGGWTRGANCSEARAMADWVRVWAHEQWGQEAVEALTGRLILEETSINTAASARHTLPLAQAAGLKAVGLVSDTLHIRRAAFLFTRHFAPHDIAVYPLSASGLFQHYWYRRRYLHLGKMALRETAAWFKALAERALTWKE